MRQQTGSLLRNALKVNQQPLSTVLPFYANYVTISYFLHIHKFLSNGFIALHLA